MEMKTVAFFLLFYMLSETSCDNENYVNTEGPKLTLLSFASDDIYKGLDSKTFAIQITDEYHTKGFICPEATGYFSDDLDCQLFYMCSEGRVKHLRCLPGYAFDSSQGYCHPKKDVTSCTPPTPTVINNNSTTRSNSEVLRCNEDGAYADATDCGNYYICVARKPIQFQCPEDTKFDHISKKCLPSNKAVCLSSSKLSTKPSWIPNGSQGPPPQSASELTSQESKYFSFVAYHPSM